MPNFKVGQAEEGGEHHIALSPFVLPMVLAWCNGETKTLVFEAQPETESVRRGNSDA
jgi:hypothetical protein